LGEREGQRGIGGRSEKVIFLPNWNGTPLLSIKLVLIEDFEKSSEKWWKEINLGWFAHGNGYFGNALDDVWMLTDDLQIH
jgi:hypothetical protein